MSCYERTKARLHRSRLVLFALRRVHAAALKRRPDHLLQCTQHNCDLVPDLTPGAFSVRKGHK